MNAMKEVKIIQSKTEPNKNHLWLSDEGLRQFKGTGWEQVLSNDNEGSDGGSNIKYYDVSNLIIDLQTNTDIASVSIIGKIIKNGVFSILPNFMIALIDQSFKLRAIGIDENMKMYLNNELVTVKSFLITANQYDVLLACPELTEEQFYDLNE